MASLVAQQRICLQCRRLVFHLWVRKIPWRREWLSTPAFLPGEFHFSKHLLRLLHAKPRVLEEASELHLSQSCSPILLFLLEAHLILTLSSLAPVTASQRSLNRYAGCFTTFSKTLHDLPS